MTLLTAEQREQSRPREVSAAWALDRSSGLGSGMMLTFAGVGAVIGVIGSLAEPSTPSLAATLAMVYPAIRMVWPAEQGPAHERLRQVLGVRRADVVAARYGLVVAVIACAYAGYLLTAAAGALIAARPIGDVAYAAWMGLCLTLAGALAGMPSASSQRTVRTFVAVMAGGVGATLLLGFGWMWLFDDHYSIDSALSAAVALAVLVVIAAGGWLSLTITQHRYARRDF